MTKRVRKPPIRKHADDSVASTVIVILIAVGLVAWYLVDSGTAQLGTQLGPPVSP